MKKTFAFAFLFLCLGALAAEARIGESQQEVATRYGQAKKEADRLKAAGAETYHYLANGFGITVVYLNGKSVWEMFERKDKEITDDDIKELLKVNSSGGHSWHFEKKDKTWERGDKKLVAFREPGHSDFFSIKDADAVKAAEGKTKPSAAGF